MSMIKAKVYVTLKKGVLDPQGKAVLNSLLSLGYEGVKEVRVGKLIELALEESDLGQAAVMVEDMCRKLLANTIIEEFRFELGEDGQA